MKSFFSMVSFIEKFTAFGERQKNKEVEAAEYIENMLHEFSVSFHVQQFDTEVPNVIESMLLVDGKNIKAVPTSFISGEISSKDHIISNLFSSQKNFFDYNINFNPHCSSISRSNHYQAPSFAISQTDIPLILEAQSVNGSMNIENFSYISRNILVGNIKNPKTILFCHYDSIGPGAIDNASGTAILLHLIIHYPETLKDTLYVIAGNEELSYDKPIYWGRGYRAFEETYFDVLKNAKQIFVVDCVGNGPLTIEQNIDIVRLGFPICHLETWQEKIYMFYGSLEKLMEVYHSDLDTPDKIDPMYLDECVNVLKNKIITS